MKRYRHLDADSACKPMTSAVVVETFGGHDHVRIWTRGQLAGTLIVAEGDGEVYARTLILDAIVTDG